PFALENWISRETSLDLLAQAESLSGRGDEGAVVQTIRRIFDRHPEIPGLIPLLLDHGDPGGREFALRTAATERSPALLEALRDFALGARGPDALRFEAAQVATEARLIAPGRTRMWLEGEWRELLLLGYEIHGEVLRRH